MPSQLTRSVFRRLLSNEGLVIRCASQTSLPGRFHQRNASASVLRPPTRRTMFGFSRKPERKTKEADFAPGLEAMIQLSVREKWKAQLPDREGLVKAWVQFFEYKFKKKEAVNNIQASHALTTYKHLRRDMQDGGKKLDIKDLRNALTVLGLMPRDDTLYHVEFAKLLYADCSALRAREGLNTDNDKDLLRLIEVLTRTGDSSEARDLVLSQQALSQGDTTLKALLTNTVQRRLWYHLLSGFAREGNEAEMLKTYEILEDARVLHNAMFRDIIISFYASKDDVVATKKWYEKPNPGSVRVHLRATTLKEVLKFSIRNDELDWCKTVFRELLASDPPKETWDIVLLWAAGALGKGVEDVERMMEVMVRRSPDNEAMAPDAETINELVELAISSKDPYLAERYISLGHKFGIRPNAKTYALQMSYRTDANDFRGTQAAYELLQAEEVVNDEDLPAINKYIRALCSAKTLDYDRIISITSDLAERQKRLEAETACALTKLYLSRDETTELINLIHSESYHYTFEERAAIRQAFMDFCLSPETSTIRSWTAYTVLHPLFDETTVAQRTLLMNNFFSRGRCDMASYVFGHMRAHDLLDRRPVLDTYVQCFLGIASCADREALDMVHNMLKMDTSIEPTTTLYNSLMLAYTACEDADRALDFWDDITNSREGPTYRSLEIVFWVCSRKPFGDKRAREIWDKMRRMEIEITQEVFSAYVGSQSGQGKLEEAKEICERVPAELGLTVDFVTLGTFYNSIPGQNRKDLVEEWAKDKFPEAWKELEKLGQAEHEEGHMLFNMKREFKA